MNAWLTNVQGFLPSLVAAPVWLVLLVKSTAMLLAAWLAHLALLRANPRWRVLLWRMTAVGLLALPTIAWFFPALKIHVSQPPPAKEAASAPVASQPVLADRAVTGLVRNLPERPAPNFEPMEPRELPGETSYPPFPPPHDLSPAAPQPTPFPWSMLLLGVWLLGTAGLVSRLFLGHYRVARMVRRAQPSPPWIESEGGRVAQAIGCRRRARVVQSSHIESPLLCGLRRPVLLLPPRMCDESYRPDLPGILAHELTHVRSHDLAWNLGLHVISIVLWFHPLAWRMRKAHLAACELVCDAVSADFVGNVAAYCRTLARVAVEAVAALPEGGIAMARTSAIGRRLNALKRGVFSRSLRRPSVLGFGLTALLAVTVLGAMRLALAAAPAEEKNTQPAKSADAESKTASLRVRVVEESGKPLAGTKLKAEYLGHKADYTTDANGWASVVVPAPNAKFLSLTAYPDEYPPVWKWWRNDAGDELIPAEFTFTYERGRTIGGVVRDEQGKPIVGAKVSLSIWPERYPLPNMGLALSNQGYLTDATGHWHLDHVPAKIEIIAIGLEHPDYIVDVGRRQVSDPEKRQIESGTAVRVMKKGLPVAGTVTDPEGKPLARAAVIRGEWHSGKRPTVSTDHNGHYRFANLAPGSTDLTVIYPGLAPALRNVNVQAAMQPVDFQLEKGHALRLRVVGKDGKPIQGISVEPEDWRGKRVLSGLPMNGKTDAEGRWSWTWAPQDAVKTNIYSTGRVDYLSIALPLKAQAAEQVVTLYRAPTISGRVVDAATKQLIPSFRVIPGYRHEGDLENLVLWNRREVVEGKNGQYELKFRSSALAHLVRIEADGHQPAISREFKDDEGSATYDFSLGKAENLTALVRLPDGKPAAGAEVALFPEQAGGNVLMGRSIANGRFLFPGPRRPTLKVGADGRLPIEPQDDGFLLVVLHDQGYAQTTSEALIANPEIKLTAWARLEGVVRNRTKPVSGAKLSARPTQDRKWWFLDFRENAETDAEGKFVFAKLKPGKWTVIKQPAGAAMLEQRQEMVDLAPGQTVRLTLGGGGRPVIGQLQWPGGKPPEGDLSHIAAYLLPNTTTSQPPSPPEATREQGPDAVRAWMNQWMQSDEGKAWQTNRRQQVERRPRSVTVSRDGALRIEDGIAGDFALLVSIPLKDEILPWEWPESLTFVAKITIPEIPGGASETPLDLGKFAVIGNRPVKISSASVKPPAAQAPGEETAGGVQDHLELLRYIVATYQENKAKIKTWQGRAKVEDRSRTVFDKQTTGQDYSATAQFVFDRARKSLLWNTTLEKLTRIEQGQESPLPVPQVSNGMQTPEAFYRLGSLGRPVNPAKRPLTLGIFASDGRSGERMQPYLYDFNPLFYLETSHGDVIRSVSRDLGVNAKPAVSQVKVTRAGDQVTIVSSVGGMTTERYTLSLSQGCNPISFQTSSLQGTLENRWTWELRDGVWLPLTWSETIKNSRDAERKVTFVENRVNQPVAADAFSLSHLGLERGDNVQDRRTQQKYQYEGE